MQRSYGQVEKETIENRSWNFLQFVDEQQRKSNKYVWEYSSHSCLSNTDDSITEEEYKV